MNPKLSIAAAAVGLVLALTAAGEPWVQTTPLPDGYQEHALVYASGFLYQTGGSSSSNAEIDGTNVFYSQVFSNGTIGVWKRGPSLPEPVFDHSSVTANGFVYVLGGNHWRASLGDFPTNLVYCAKIDSDGRLGSWQIATSLPYSADFQSASVWNKRIYVIGGWVDSNHATNGVFSAAVQSDGSLSSWTEHTSMPNAVYTQSGAANGFLYVSGGAINQGTVIENTVYFTRINMDGGLSGWNQTALLPIPMSGLATVATRGRILAMAGWNGSAPISGVFIATVAGDGSLNSWSTGTALPDFYIYQAVTASDSHIYLSGGATPAETTSAVYSMALPSPPTAPRLVGEDHFQLQLGSSANTGFGLLASTDLTSWTNIGWGFTDTNGSMIFQDTNAANLRQRFYRAYWPLP